MSASRQHGVSIITVCRNAAGTIRRTLESVQAQKGVDFEHIVIDGASTDGTQEIIRAFPVVWISEPDGGLYDALNKGISRATGDIVGILNADDVFEDETTLARVVAAFTDEVAVVYGDIRFVRGARTVRYYSARFWRPWMARWGYMIPHPAFYVRRAEFARLGLYRTDFRISADFELMVRYLVLARLPARHCGASLVVMSPGGISTASPLAYLRANRENVRALRLNGIFSCLPMMLPKYLYKVMGLLFRM